MNEWTLDITNGNYFTIDEESNIKSYGLPAYKDLIYVGAISYYYPVEESTDMIKDHFDGDNEWEEEGGMISQIGSSNTTTYQPLTPEGLALALHDLDSSFADEIVTVESIIDRIAPNQQMYNTLMTQVENTIQDNIDTDRSYLPRENTDTTEMDRLNTLYEQALNNTNGEL